MCKANEVVAENWGVVKWHFLNGSPCACILLNFWIVPLCIIRTTVNSNRHLFNIMKN